MEPRYNEVLGTMKITLLYQVSHYIRVKKQRNTKSWDQQNYLVIRGFCYIRPLYNEVPLYLFLFLRKSMLIHKPKVNSKFTWMFTINTSKPWHYTIHSWLSGRIFRSVYWTLKYCFPFILLLDLIPYELLFGSISWLITK